MTNKYKGQKRRDLKKRFDKWKRIEKNNLPDGQRFQLTSFDDLRSAEFKSKVRREFVKK